MLILSVHERPVATMVADEKGYTIKYLDGVGEGESLSPNLPVGKQAFHFDGLPEFLNSLLPDEETRIQVAKAFGFDQDDSYRLVVNALGTHNIGHIKVSRGVDGFDEEPYEVIGMTPRNPELVGTTLSVLENEGNQQEMREAVARARGSVGIGGHFPKTVMRTREGRFIVKVYPAFERSLTEGSTVADMEAATLQAARYAGLKAPGAKSYGNLLVVQRFDNPGTKVHHLRDITNDKDKYHGSYERLRDVVEDKAGREAAVEFTKHIIFAWILRDADKHQENCALLEKDGQFALAPVYDAVPSSLIEPGEQELGLKVVHRNGNYGWKEMTEFTDGYLSQEELKQFSQKAIKGIMQLVVPVSKNLKEKLTRQLYYVSQVMEGKSNGMARKALAQVMTAKQDPAGKMDPKVSTPMSEVPLELPEPDLGM